MHNFFHYVEYTNNKDCWLWRGCKNEKGYGILGPRYAPYRRAHRYMWFLANGIIPSGMFVLHTCDNPSCVNIAHLKLGTPQDNMSDKMEKGRHRYNAMILKKVGFKKGNPGYGYRRITDA